METSLPRAQTNDLLICIQPVPTVASRGNYINRLGRPAVVFVKDAGQVRFVVNVKHMRICKSKLECDEEIKANVVEVWITRRYD